MKPGLMTIGFILALLFTCQMLMAPSATCAGGSWLAVQNVSNDKILSGRPEIAIDGRDMVHIVWVGQDVNSSDIFYSKQKSDGTWEKSVNISSTSGHSSRPSISAGTDNIVHVTWRDEVGGNTEIFYARKDTNGWMPPLNISNTSTVSFKSKIRVDIENRAHAVWEEDNGIAYSFMNGTQWEVPIFITDESSKSNSWPEIAASKTTTDMYVVCGQYMRGKIERTEIMFIEKNDLGWSVPLNISNTSGPSERPALSTDLLGNIHVVWRDGVVPCGVNENCVQEGTDYVAGKGDIYYAMRNDNGWSTPVLIAHTPVDSARPAIATDSMNNIHVVWQDSSYGKYQIFYTSNINGVWTPVEMISQGLNSSSLPSIAVDSKDQIYVVWEEYTGNHNREIFCRKRLSPYL